jgi:hypothetical protein
VIEVEREEFIGTVWRAYGCVDTRDEFEACIDVIGGDIGLGKLFEEVERGIVNVDRNIDIFFLIVVTRHLTNDSISWKSHFALFWCNWI